MVALPICIRATVQNGDLYRLFSPRAGDLTANQYVGPGGRQAVLFAFRHSQQYNTPAATIRLRGLDPRATYRIESIDNKLVDKMRYVARASNRSITSWSISGPSSAAPT